MEAESDGEGPVVAASGCTRGGSGLTPILRVRLELSRDIAILIDLECPLMNSGGM